MPMVFVFKVGVEEKWVFLIGVIITNWNSKFIDIKKLPWSNENTQNVKPTNADLASEVLRRQEVVVFPGSCNDKHSSKSNQRTRRG
jgi:hypothetical protein